MTRLAFSRVRLVVLIPLTLLLIGSRSLFDAERAHLTTPALVVAYGVPIAASAVLVCALTRRPGSRRWDAAALWGALSAFAVLCSVVDESVVVTPALGVVASLAATTWAVVSSVPQERESEKESERERPAGGPVGGPD